MDIASWDRDVWAGIANVLLAIGGASLSLYSYHRRKRGKDM